MGTWIEALELAVKAHGSQVDKVGDPYILHPLRVSMRIGKTSGFDHPVAIVGLLHDVLEDTAVDVWDLWSAGYSVEIINALEALTHKEGEEYSDYILRVRENKLAVVVKLADIFDNLDPNRLEKLDPETASRLVAKYGMALGMLN
jgi:(p)ppGpp synthase/HD superfamily hydrolase